MALDCTLPPVWLVPTGVYLIYFLIGNLSYSPGSEPSHTVLFLDVMYSTDPHQRQKSIIFTPLGRSISSIDKVARYSTWQPGVLPFWNTFVLYACIWFFQMRQHGWRLKRNIKFFFFLFIGCTVPLGAMMCVLINALKTEWTQILKQSIIVKSTEKQMIFF